MVSLNDKRGITFFYTLMLGVSIIVLGLALATPTKQFVDTSRTNMDCSNVSISKYDQATCMGLDILLPLEIGGIIFIGIAIIGAKIVLGG